MAPTEQAPEKTDCLTSIYYIFKQALNITLPLTLIGDMPRTLLSLGEWKLLCVDTNDVCCGDLCFSSRITDEKLIGHVSLFLGVNEIFHCRREGAVIEDYETFQSVFEQKLHEKQIYYIDIRNKALREKHEGIFCHY